MASTSAVTDRVERVRPYRLRSPAHLIDRKIRGSFRNSASVGASLASGDQSMATPPTRKPLVTRFHLLVFVVLAAIAVVAFYKIPAGVDLPVHWGFDGKPDEVWPRVPALLVFPGLGVVLIGLFAAIGRLAAPAQLDPGRYILEAALTGVLGLFCAIEFAMILLGIGSDIDMIRVIAFAVAVLLVLIGSALPRSQPNAYAGIRLPWTLHDADAWRAAHRLAGVLYLIAGVALGVLAWLRPEPPELLPGMLAAVLLPPVIGGLFSLMRARR
jgi:uncharacterized membrane protein